MKITKRLLAVVLAGVMALTILAGCSGSSKITFGKKIYEAFIKDVPPELREQYSYSEELSGRAEAVLKAIDKKVQKEGGEVTWENAICLKGSKLMGFGFVGEDNPIKKAVFGRNEPAEYYVVITLTEVSTDSLESIAYKLIDSDMMGIAGNPNKMLPMKMGTAKYKAANGKTYAAMIGFHAE